MDPLVRVSLCCGERTGLCTSVGPSSHESATSSLDREGVLNKSAWSKKKGAEAQKNSIDGREIRRTLPAATNNQELLLKEQIRGDDTFDTTRASEFGDGYEEIEQKECRVLHAGEG